MATDYILFIHGVNTRDRREKPQYADRLYELISQQLQGKVSDLRKLALYWGDVNADLEDDILTVLKSSSLWSKMWFQSFREKQLLQFVGDAALYISRHTGYRVVERIRNQAEPELFNCDRQSTRLHLVTHSWGTVILFDILFAGRWDDPAIPGHEDVMSIRDAIFGISGRELNPLQGLEIASIHTMGSPIAIFSLIDVKPGKDTPEGAVKSSHDITPKLQQLLKNLYDLRQEKEIPWKNFINPGDPIAYPLNELLSRLVGGQKKYLDTKDLLVTGKGLLNFFAQPFSQSFISLVQGGDAHSSYWQDEKIAKEIAASVLSSYVEH